MINKSWFFEKLNEIDKPLAQITKGKKKAQITKLRTESRIATSNLREKDKITL